jgi:uncharacterized membrane protein
VTLIVSAIGGLSATGFMGSASIGLSDRQLDEARRPQYSSIVARRSKSSTWTLKLALLVLLVAGAASFFITSQAPSFISVGSDSDLVMIPTDTLGREQVKFYSYRDRAGQELRFILGRDSNGEVHAAMDACQRCYTYHKGYIWSHGYMVCKFCGNRYKLPTMESGLGSCVPVRLPVRVTGRSITIKSADLEHERRLF